MDRCPRGLTLAPFFVNFCAFAYSIVLCIYIIHVLEMSLERLNCNTLFRPRAGQVIMNDRDRNPIRYDIYASSFRPARGLGQGIDKPNLPGKTSSARKWPGIHRDDAAGANHASSSSQGTAPPPSSSGTSSSGNFFRPHRVARKFITNDRVNRGYDEVTNDDRYLPARRDLLPKPTYSLRGRPGTAHWQSRPVAGISAARKSSMVEAPPGVWAARKNSEQEAAGRLAARKYDASKSVRFVRDDDPVSFFYSDSRLFSSCDRMCLLPV